MGKLDAVGLGLHHVHKECNLGGAVGMGVGNNGGSRGEQIFVLGGHAWSSQRKSPHIGSWVFCSR